MYEALKGVARRTTQSLRERTSRTEVSAEEAQLLEISSKVRSLDSKSRFICERVIKVARLMEELGNTLKEIGEEYSQAPDLVVESRELAEDVRNVGTRLVETSLEHQKGLKDNGFGVLHQFSKNCAKLDEAEARRRNAQLEHDFFFNKVLNLRKDPPKDVSRIPRNEHVLENWRVELWQATESNKALASSLYTEGRRAIDRSVLTTVQVVHSFVDIASTGFKQTFFNARLPEYPDDPVLVAAPLPPNPLPPFQPPGGVYGYTYYSAPSPPPTTASQGSTSTATASAAAPALSPVYTANTTPYARPTALPQGGQSPPPALHTNTQTAHGMLGSLSPDSGYRPPQVDHDSQPTPYTPPPT